MLSMDSLGILGGLVKKIGNFSMKDFKSRLVFQKTIYFMNYFGFDLGYNFDWYIAGPYSSELASDGFKLNISYKNVKEAKIIDPELEEKFQRFTRFIKRYRNPHELELLASVHFLKKLGLDKRKALKMMQNKKEKFSKDEFNNAVLILKEEGLF
jgi:uncharacterized protein YwgA